MRAGSGCSGSRPSGTGPSSRASWKRSSAISPGRSITRARRRNAGELISLLDGLFATRTLAEWAERFDREDLWWAPVQTQDEVVADPQVRAMNGIVSVPDYGGEGTFEAVATPLEFSAATVGPQGPPPRLGEHTDAVLRELGVSDAEIAALRASGAAR